VIISTFAIISVRRTMVAQAGKGDFVRRVKICMIAHP
jgi:hypothetical protein